MSGVDVQVSEAIVPRSGPALLAFGASWCAPWLLLQSALDELDTGQVPVVRVDVDQDVATAERWRVVTVPTFVVVLDGTERKRLTGAVSRTDLRKAVEQGGKRRRR